MKKGLKRLLFFAVVSCTVMFSRMNTEAADGTLANVEEMKLMKVSDEEFTELVGERKAVSGKQGFLKEFQKHAVNREKSFRIVYSGNVNDIPVNTLIEDLAEIDDKKTSDDADFLSGGILNLGWTSYYNSSNQLVLDCKLTYTESSSQVKKVNTKSKAILKKLKVSSMSDVAKVKVIHDYVVKLVTYDHSLKDHSAYGGLAASKHSTVCQGYALIMYKLLTDAGVPVHYVTGNAGGPHAWNIVKINGNWYNLDATWDDPSDTTSYDYFLIGTKQMNKDHTLDKYYKSKYKIASSNLNWKKLIKNSGKKDDKKVKTDQTKKEKTKSDAARLRAEAIKLISSSLDEALKEDPDATDYEVQMYDLCKKIYGFIIEDMSDKAFEALLDNDEMLDAYIDGTLEYIEQYILEPMIAYMDSDDFMDEIYSQMYADFGENEFEGMTDKELESLVEAYAYGIFTDLLYYQSEQYTDAIVEAMVKEMNQMAK